MRPDGSSSLSRNPKPAARSCGAARTHFVFKGQTSTVRVTAGGEASAAPGTGPVELTCAAVGEVGPGAIAAPRARAPQTTPAASAREGEGRMVLHAVHAGGMAGFLQVQAEQAHSLSSGGSASAAEPPAPAPGSPPAPRSVLPLVMVRPLRGACQVRFRWLSNAPAEGRRPRGSPNGTRPRRPGKWPRPRSGTRPQPCERRRERPNGAPKRHPASLPSWRCTRRRRCVPTFPGAPSQLRPRRRRPRRLRS